MLRCARHIAKKAAASQVAAKAPKPRKAAPKSRVRKVAKPALLAGGNPQIAKADGDAPVQAYIAAMPGWKRSRAPPRRAHRAHRPRRAQGSQMELAAIRSRGPGLVPQLSLFHEIREGGFLPRRVPAASSARRVQAKGRALPRHLRGRPARRSPARRLGEASEPFARRTNASAKS